MTLLDDATIERDARDVALMKDGDVPASVCPSCSKSLNATAALGDFSPKPGDLSVCAYCLATLAFDEQLRVRLIPDDELRTLDMETCIRIGNTKRLLRRIRGNARNSLSVEQLVREGSR